MAPILLVLVLLGLAVLAVVLWPLLNARDTSELRRTTATVVESRPCGGNSPGDLVSVRVDGVERKARFDGCGHNRGQRLDVVVPRAPGADFVVRPADGATSQVEQVSSRVTWVLATVAAVAGGGYAVMLRLRRP